jgi:hypothetical protein
MVSHETAPIPRRALRRTPEGRNREFETVVSRLRRRCHACRRAPESHGLRSYRDWGRLLPRQLRRAVSSIGLDAGEGLYASGGNRTVRIESAMNSGREVILGLRIARSSADAAGYLDADLLAREVDAVDRIVATLYKLEYRAR